MSPKGFGVFDEVVAVDDLEDFGSDSHGDAVAAERAGMDGVAVRAPVKQFGELGADVRDAHGQPAADAF